MSEEELIETLRAFEKNRVEQLEEPARNLFYAIMKIAGERDRLNNIINEVREYIEKHLEREYFDYDILEANTIYNRDLYKVLKILDKAGNSNERNKDNK